MSDRIGVFSNCMLYCVCPLDGGCLLLGGDVQGGSTVLVDLNAKLRLSFLNVSCYS